MKSFPTNLALLQKEVEQLVTPFIEEKGVDLIEFRILGNGRKRFLRIFVDRPGGITIDECASLSHDLADLLDTHDPIESKYVLEVSSPGLNRPLITERDYQRAIGKLIQIEISGERNLEGVLVSRDSENVVLKTKDGIFQVPLSNITKTNLHSEIRKSTLRR